MKNNGNLLNVGLDSVMGYFRPVSQFNKGKKSEFAERVCFKEEKTIELKKAV